MRHRSGADAGRFQADSRRYPKPVFIGTAGQLIILPAIASGLAWVFHPPPFIVAGMVLVAACPGGAISNYSVYLARADVALSVTLTAVSTVFAFITLPLSTGPAIRQTVRPSRIGWR